MCLKTTNHCYSCGISSKAGSEVGGRTRGRADLLNDSDFEPEGNDAPPNGYKREYTVGHASKLIRLYFQKDDTLVVT